MLPEQVREHSARTRMGAALVERLGHAVADIDADRAMQRPMKKGMRQPKLSMSLSGRACEIETPTSAAKTAPRF